MLVENVSICLQKQSINEIINKQQAKALVQLSSF